MPNVKPNRSPPPPRYEEPKRAPMDPHVLAKYSANNRILRRFARASGASLERFATILEKASDADLERAARYLEGLADWPDPDVSSR